MIAPPAPLADIGTVNGDEQPGHFDARPANCSSTLKVF
jgi:hypothetical protein